MDRRRLVLLILLGGCCAASCVAAMPLGCLSETYQSKLCWRIGCVLNWHGTGRSNCPPYRPPTPTVVRPPPAAEPARQVTEPAYTSPSTDSAYTSPATEPAYISPSTDPEPTGQGAIPGPAGQDTMPDSARRTAMVLLTEYDLHPTGELEWLSDELLDMSDDVWHSLKYFAETSGEIGLDMSAHDGSTVHLYGVWLREQCQSDEGTISAVFAVSEDEVIGAALFLSGYVGGPTPLSDRSSFTIPGLAPDNLDFRTVHRVEVLGPSAESGDTIVVELNKEERATVLDILTHAEFVHERLPIDPDIWPYVVALYPDSGGRIVAKVSMDAPNTETRVTYSLGGFRDVYFIADPRIRTLLQAVLEP